MTSKTRPAIAGVALSISAWISGALVAAQKPRMSAQRTEIPKVVSVRGGGEKSAGIRARATHVAAPSPLSAEEKSRLLRSAGVKETNARDSFKLTPAKPLLPQGALAFEEPQFFDPKANELTVGGQDSFFDTARINKAVMLYLYPVAGKKYLIDFSVTGGKFFVSNVPGNMKETFNGTHHVLIIFEGTANYEEDFLLTGTPAREDNVWTFHSCEVTPLN